MDFKFNFNGENDASSGNLNYAEEISTKNLRECRKHMNCTAEKRPFLNLEDHFNKIVRGDIELFFLKPDVAETQIESNDVNGDGDFSSFLQSSDLASGEYEGGLKVWECTIDLIQYMQDHRNLFKDKRVLDLGCGAGLLGAYAFLLESGKVCFQDYNSEVIENFTLPSVEKTLVQNGKENLSDNNNFEFISGDWSNVNNYFINNNNEKFDVILSSETIYNTNYYRKIKEVLQNLLSDSGVALFAAKKHYFGVGGGIFDFIEYLHSVGLFETNIVKTIDDSLPREILQVKKSKR